MAHGGGGRAMRGLIAKIILPAFHNPLLASLEDQARLPMAELAAQVDALVLVAAGSGVARMIACVTPAHVPRRSITNRRQ